MDSFGIGNAIRGAAQIYFQSARGSGRTTSLVESLKTGDRVVFTNHREADRVQRLCKELGVEIRTMVLDTKNPSAIFDRGSSTGRTIFDHSWVEQYYLQVLEGAARDLDHLQRESSGFGMAHIETRIKAREAAKWTV